MINEHEIPSGSRLYFGKSAKLKREIEATASQFLSEAGFQEIVTPFFSYHQHKSIDAQELVRFSDVDNHILSLRADSTQDVVRLITKRLGRSTNHSKWFYIQPVFKYPSLEVNQIGAEFIGTEDLSLSIQVCVDIFQKFGLKPLLHISNINIPLIIAKELNVSLDIFEKSELQKILSLNIPWLEALACMQEPKDIDAVINIVPDKLKPELEKMEKLYSKIEYENVHFAPLYYVHMRYYDELFFRFIEGNRTLAKGGNYQSEGIKSTGFGLYTDALIETIS